ncbi:hypothetical protein ALC53_08508 [Atta colombica]|uniref:Uncharacterized protein n=1 Tax=Atta colombica TaxID=520822 RepID=A0A195BAB3_9HYME|nr:hypothetical protein ALC53_08508 [Atta colombica]
MKEFLIKEISFLQNSSSFVIY